MSEEQNIVKKVCKELNVNQRELGEIVDVPVGTISRWASTDDIPKMAKLALEYIEDLVKENLLKLNKEEIKIIPIQPTPLNGSQGFLDYFKNKTVEINNSLAIPESFLAKSISSRCIDDGVDAVGMILNLHRNRESGKIQIECIKERTPKISFMILDDPIKKGKR